MKKRVFAGIGLAVSMLGSPAVAQEKSSQEKSSHIEFGQGYVRAFVESVYLPQMTETASLLTIKVRTGNKKPLEFPWIIEGKPGQTYSSIGARAITPYFALNTKSPLTVDVSLRSHKPVPQFFGIGTKLLQSVSEAIPVPQISALANYANTANQLADRYGDATTITDYNQQLLRDDAREYNIPLDKHSALFFFTKGNAMFTAYDEKGQKKWLTASMISDIESLPAAMTSRQEAPYHYIVTTVEDGKEKKSRFRPTGKEAVVKVSFEQYSPYPTNGFVNLENSNFYGITGVRDHFANLEKLRAKHTKLDVFKGAALEATGQFADALTTLVETGDLSLSDAGALGHIFRKRVIDIGVKLDLANASDGKAPIFNALTSDKIKADNKAKEKALVQAARTEMTKALQSLQGSFPK